VKDSENVLFGMSNNHVTGSCSFAGVGLPILAPGVVDVAPNALPPFTVGFHEAALPLIAGSTDNVDHTKNLDAAIFRIRDPSQVSSFQGTAYDTPPQTTPLVADLVVEKVGRTTGHTVGTVGGQMNGAYGFPYMAALYEFSGRVFFDGIFAISGEVDPITRTKFRRFLRWKPCRSSVVNFPKLSFFSAVVAAVDMWATRQRCPSAASCPQPFRRSCR
jgi:hypothetical protein